LRAIAAAGGPLNSAKLNSVLLVRRGEQHNLTAERLDLTPAKVDVMLGNDLPIEAYDLIYIPKTIIADVDAWISQVYRIITPPLDIYTRSLYYKSLIKSK